MLALNLATLGFTSSHTPALPPPPGLSQLAYGADVARLPAGSFLRRAALSSTAGPSADPGGYGVLGVSPQGDAGGHVAVYGDSNCLDTSHQHLDCYAFLLKLLARVNTVGYCWLLSVAVGYFVSLGFTAPAWFAPALFPSPASAISPSHPCQAPHHPPPPPPSHFDVAAAIGYVLTMLWRLTPPSPHLTLQ